MRLSCFSTEDSSHRAFLVPVYLLFFLCARYLFLSTDFVGLFSVVARPKMTNTSNTSATESFHEPQDNKTTAKGIIYGHVHMAKTGGSSINGRLALQFERVCGT